MKFSGRTFSNETINLDDNEFYDCTFIGCRLIYAGGETTLAGNSYDELTTYTFSGAAANTLAILSALYADRGGKFITRLFENIRQTAADNDDILDADALDWK
jgi:hypothetical protein